jgi:hypothetical protein
VRLSLLAIALFCVTAASQTISLTGTVSSNGQPLQGVIVSLITAHVADTTDANGHFQISSSSAVRSGIGGSLNLNSIRFDRNRFEFDVASQGRLTAALYTLRGARVAMLCDRTVQPGTMSVPLSAGFLGRSVYVLQVNFNGKRHSFSLLPCQQTGVFSMNEAAPAAQQRLGKTTAAEWIQAVKPGYASYLEQLTITSGTKNISLSPLAAATPNFGPDVFVFAPSMSAAAIQNILDSISTPMLDAQFGNDRYAFLFKPGSYAVDVNVGFYTQALGLGLTPDSVRIAGQVHSEADWMNGNATCTFWKSAEGFCVTPPGGTNKWAASQAAPNRRMHINGNVMLDDGGWASGGFFADCKIDGLINGGAQQQYFSRNGNYNGWNGGGWNMVFVGVPGGPSTSFAVNRTVVPKTPLIAEKPFLAIDNKGNYFVLVPDFHRDSTAGVSWAGGETPGTKLPLDLFYLGKPSDNAASLNAALAQGKNLLLTPGHYNLESAVKVTRPGAIVLGIGFPTLAPTNGNIALKISDVDGIRVGGLLLEGTTQNAPALVEVGDSGTTVSHAQNPIGLYDIFCRAGGQFNGLVTCFVKVNSNDVILDHAWLWRADHGTGAGWNSNKNANGLIVNGNNVTAYGLFVEHTQAYQTWWRGNGGRTFFYQSELPYDPPDNLSWSASATTLGYPSYKVADNVKTHEAWGLGIYSVFRNEITASCAIQVPANVPGVKIHHMVTKKLADGTLTHVINDTGGVASAEVEEYP